MITREGGVTMKLKDYTLQALLVLLGEFLNLFLAFLVVKECQRKVKKFLCIMQLMTFDFTWCGLGRALYSVVIHGSPVKNVNMNTNWIEYKMVFSITGCPSVLELSVSVVICSLMVLIWLRILRLNFLACFSLTIF